MVLMIEGCTAAQITEILNIAQGVLTAGEGLIPVLAGGGQVAPAQGVEVAAYVKDSGDAIAAIIGEAQGKGILLASNVATGLISKRAALGALPRVINDKVNTMDSGVRKALSIDVTGKQVSMLSNPGAYRKLSRMRKRAESLARQAAKLI